MSDKTGGPAFPAQHSIDGNWVKEPLPGYRGMTLRDYFAAKAMIDINWESCFTDAHAIRCYEIADAMLKARGK